MTGRPARALVHAYHGRPMCCAAAMYPHSVTSIKRDLSIAQYYLCNDCNKIVVLYFNTDGTLHHNQSPRCTGRYRRAYH